MPAGRPPKPTHLKLIEGNPGKRPLNAANEVQPLGSPTAPKIMTKRAKAIWTRLLKVMPARVWTGADSNALANYCEAQARYEEMTLALLEGAPTFETNYAGQRHGQRPERTGPARGDPRRPSRPRPGGSPRPRSDRAGQAEGLQIRLGLALK
jgi:hypothetical protein